MNLYEKLIEIRKEVEYLQKNKKAYGYKYVSEDQAYNAIKSKMNELKILLVPSIVPNTRTISEFEYTTSKGSKVKETIIHADMIFTWIDAESGEKHEVPFILAGQQTDVSQALGSGLTYCSRYFVLKYFQVATNEDDPDKWRSDQKMKEEKKPKKKEKKIENNVGEITLEKLQKLLDSKDYDEKALQGYIQKQGFTIENVKVAQNYQFLPDELIKAIYQILMKKKDNKEIAKDGVIEEQVEIW